MPKTRRHVPINIGRFLRDRLGKTREFSQVYEKAKIKLVHMMRITVVSPCKRGIVVISPCKQRIVMRFFIVVLSTLFITPALAGIGPLLGPVDVVDTEETGYVGLVWTLNGGISQTPEVSVGFQSVDVEANGDIDEGYDINLRFAWNDMNLPTDYSLRASSLFGDIDMITNLGLGITNKGNVLATAGVQGDYLRIGLDLSGAGLEATGEVLSLELPDAPEIEFAP